MINDISKFLKLYSEVYEIFTFDYVFRFLLKSNFNHKEALVKMFCHCSFSALVFQERIHNNYYLRINADEQLSEDIKELVMNCLITG